MINKQTFLMGYKMYKLAEETKLETKKAPNAQEKEFKDRIKLMYNIGGTALGAAGGGTLGYYLGDYFDYPVLGTLSGALGGGALGLYNTRKELKQLGIFE